MLRETSVGVSISFLTDKKALHPKKLTVDTTWSLSSEQNRSCPILVKFFGSLDALDETFKIRSSFSGFSAVRKYSGIYWLELEAIFTNPLML